MFENYKTGNVVGKLLKLSKCENKMRKRCVKGIEDFLPDCTKSETTYTFEYSANYF